MQLSLSIVIAILASVVSAAYTPSPAPAPVPAPTPSIVRCNSTIANVTCAYKYKDDPKTDGVMRCKPRADSTMACNVTTCCLPMPEFVPCSSQWANVTCPYNVYKPDPKNATLVLSCRPRPAGGYTNQTSPCTKEVCCGPLPSFVSCSDAVKCAKYNKDPKTGGVMRCKPRPNSTQSCGDAVCCVPPPKVGGYSS